MSMINELEALAILTSIPHLGAIRIRHLIHHYGSALAVLNGDPSAVETQFNFGKQAHEGLKNWRKDPSWKENLNLVEQQNIELVSYNCPKYPKRLLGIPDYPLLLYVKGEIQPKDHKTIAVIGTRQASIYGREMAEKISSDLARAGFTVVSGLARGIDTHAHVGALEQGRTFAVIGSGLNDIYPQENIRLGNEIAAHGALISEFSMATPPGRQNFPQRNRIVSGMSIGTILIEAPLKSGAMQTMEKAREHKRKLFALPGRADSESFQGNHWLIKNGYAQLIENAQDVLTSFESLFGIVESDNKQSRPLGQKLEKEEEDFLILLPNQEISIEEIVKLTHLPIMKVNSLLMGLLLKKIVREYPGKIYKKTQGASK